MNLQGIFTGISLGVAYAIVALGFTLVYRVSRVLNLAHGAVMMGVGLFLAKRGIENPVVLVALAVPLGAIGSALVHLVFIRPFQFRDHVTRLTVLVGVLFAAGGLGQVLAGTNSYITPPLVQGNVRLPGGANVGNHSIVTLVIVVVVVALLAIFLGRTTAGKSLRAIAENHRGAVLTGIRVDRLLLLTAIIAGALAGLAAVLVVPQTGVSFSAGFGWTVVAVVSAVVGGLRSVWGALLGGMLVGIGQGLMLQYSPEWFGTLQFALLVGVLAFLPQGLLGSER